MECLNILRQKVYFYFYLHLICWRGYKWLVVAMLESEDLESSVRSGGGSGTIPKPLWYLQDHLIIPASWCSSEAPGPPHHPCFLVLFRSTCSILSLPSLTVPLPCLGRQVFVKSLWTSRFTKSHCCCDWSHSGDEWLLRSNHVSQQLKNLCPHRHVVLIFPICFPFLQHGIRTTVWIQ